MENSSYKAKELNDGREVPLKQGVKAALYQGAQKLTVRCWEQKGTLTKLIHAILSGIAAGVMVLTAIALVLVIAVCGLILFGRR